MIGCPRAAAAVSGCMVREDRWILPHLAVRTHFEYSWWVSRVSQPVQRTPLWLASWLPVLDKSRGSKSAYVQRVWGIYDDRLQFMTGALGLEEALEVGDVSRAWSVWSSAVEAALLDFRVVLFLIGVWSWVVVLLWHVPLDWEVLKFVRRVGILRIHLNGVMCSCIMMLLPLSCWTSGEKSRLLGTCFML